jgi:hypothetical protein
MGLANIKNQFLYVIEMEMKIKKLSFMETVWKSFQTEWKTFL